jgi:hypothetical protein
MAKKPFYGFYGSFTVNHLNSFGNRPGYFDRAFHRITATDCDTVRPSFALKGFGAAAGRLAGAEGWQKDKPGRKMGFPWFFRHSIFPPETTSAFVRLFHNFSI